MRSQPLQTWLEALRVVNRVQESSGFVIVQHDPRPLRQDLLGACPGGLSVELAQRHAQSLGGSFFKRVLLVRHADLDAARLG